MLSGDNGILQRTTDAKERTGEAQIKEEIGLAWNGVQAEGIVNGWNINKKAEELQNELQNEDSSASTKVSENNIEVSYKGYETTIDDETGSIVNFAKAKIKISLTRIGTPVTQAEVLANIPSGFYHIGGSINEGLVISDVENDSMTPADSTGNQFVFVPVEKNQAIKLDVNSEEDIQSIVLYNPLGNKIVDLTNQGKSYSTTINAINDDRETANTDIINGEYNVQVTTENETKSKTLIVRSLYAKNSYVDVEKLSKYTDEYYQSDEWVEECGIMLLETSEATVDEVYGYLGLTYPDDKEMFISFSKYFSPETSLKSEITYLEKFTEKENYIKSVNTNGGFYIGRYEATYANGTATSKKATNIRTYSGVELADGMMWNLISQTDALAKAKTFNTKGSLLTGSAWDRTLGWLIETGNKTLQQISIDSKDWGNYGNDTFSETTGQIKTGEYEQTKANNIYDLAGNLAEWTSEMYDWGNGSYAGTMRGSGFSYTDFRTRASDRMFEGVNSNGSGWMGFRLALFL